MKGKLWLIALLLVLSLVISSYGVSAQPYELRKLIGVIGARRSTSPPADQCC
ncbi:uncharacterized protein LOC112088934 [Eutrema salsugineum]|uniref:uncharacterized protein LOC112088934 n=1 Tax=Eutrema salsugineum TaxID=72664 RepID=UPI000CED55D3|nr:uncharacterized protein LOC112088934 [Eutrema salsugineum]